MSEGYSESSLLFPCYSWYLSNSRVWGNKPTFQGGTGLGAKIPVQTHLCSFSYLRKLMWFLKKKKKKSRNFFHPIKNRSAILQKEAIRSRQLQRKLRDMQHLHMHDMQMRAWWSCLSLALELRLEPQFGTPKSSCDSFRVLRHPGLLFVLGNVFHLRNEVIISFTIRPL